MSDTKNEILALLKGISQDNQDMKTAVAGLQAEVHTATNHIGKLAKDVTALKKTVHDVNSFIRPINDFDTCKTHIIEMLDNHDKFSIISVRINNLEDFKDQGEAVVVEISRLIGRTIHENTKGRDMLYRFSEDQFHVITRDTPVSDAMRLAEEIHYRINKRPIRHMQNGNLIGKTSITCCATESLETDTAETFIDRMSLELRSA